MTATTPRYMAVQGAALLIAGVFLAIGLLGFIPGVTSDYGLLHWAGQHSGAVSGTPFAAFVPHRLVRMRRQTHVR